MQKTSRRIGKIDRRKVILERPASLKSKFIFLEPGNNFLLVDWSSLLPTQVHWIKNEFRKTIRVNCMNRSSCPGCQKGNYPVRRYLTYAVKFKYNDEVGRIGIVNVDLVARALKFNSRNRINQAGIIDINQVVYSQIETEALNFVEMSNRLVNIYVEQIGEKFKKFNLAVSLHAIDEQLMKRAKTLMKEFSTTVDLKDMCSPASKEEWEKRLAGMTFKKVARRKRRVNRFEAIMSSFKRR